MVVISICCNGNEQSCYQVDGKDFCYFQPNGTNKNGTWENAAQVCKENNSTLPEIENSMIQKKLEGHLKEQNSLLPNAWIAGREFRSSKWWWLNGKLINNQSKLWKLNVHVCFDIIWSHVLICFYRPKFNLTSPCMHYQYCLLSFWNFKTPNC